MTHPALTGPRQRPCLVIGEVAQTHDGSLGLAHAFIDAIADAGADAVKFQTHIAAAESTPAEPWRVQFSRQDATRYDYWKRMEFTEEQWRGLADHARERGLLFLSSPFSVEAVELLERVGMPLWKIASGETSNAMLLDRILDTRRAGAAVDGHEPARRDRCGGRARARRAAWTSACSSARRRIRARPRSRPEPDPVLPRALRLLGRAVGPLGDDLSGPRRRGAGHGRARGPRRAVPRDVRPRRRRVGHDVGAAPAGRRRPLHRAHAREPGRQGRLARTRPRRCASCSRRASWPRATCPPARCWRASTWPSRSRARGCPPDRLEELVGRRLRAPVAADQLLAAEDIEGSRLDPVSQTEDLRRRHRAPELLPHQDGAPRHPAGIPTSSCSSSSPPRRCSTATASAVQAIEHDGFQIAARVYMVLEGENLVTSAKSTGLGLVELATVFDNLQAGRRRHDRRPLRDARHGGRRVVHEHSGRARAGRRGHRLDRREGPPRGDQARQPAPRLHAAGRRARAADGRGARLGRRHRLSVDRPRRRGGGQSRAGLRPVREIRRRRSDDRPLEAATSS